MSSWFAYDGRLARVLLAVFWCFIVSVQFLATALPALVFDNAVAGQVTHASIWLGVLTALPIGPGAHAVLSAMRDFRSEGGYPGRPFSRFWRPFSQGARRLWWLWTGVGGIGLLLAYNAALYGGSDAVFASVMLAALLLALASVAVASAVQLGVAGRPLTVLTAALGAAAVRPLAPAAWALVLVLAAAAALLPLVGPNLALFTPALGGWAILAANGASGFDRKLIA